MPVWKSHPTIGNIEVSTDGEVRLIGSTAPIVFKEKHTGHKRKSFKGGWRYLHHLVLETFVGPKPDGMECRHLDGDPKNNKLENLKWGTHHENVQDTIRHGRHPIGEAVKTAKLTAEQVGFIRSQYFEGCSLTVLSEYYNVAVSHIHRIVNNQRWQHVGG